MKKILYPLLSLSVCIGACKNKDLDYEYNCDPDTKAIKVIVNWESPETQSRVMRFNLFSLTDEIAHYGIDEISQKGEKAIKLSEGNSYLPFCYDYNTSNINFRYETNPELFEACCTSSIRMTYENYADKAEGEETIVAPQRLYIDCPNETFDVVYTAESPDTLVFHFYPQNIIREFTYCIKGVTGVNNIKDVRGAISGMSSSYNFKSRKLSAIRSTILFEDGTIRGTNTEGYIEGIFYTFGPVETYTNRFIIEVLTSGNEYITTHWDVSDQIAESMNNRDAKLARDGYDILIINKEELPDIPDPDEGNSSGFEIEVGEWNNVTIYL